MHNQVDQRLPHANLPSDTQFLQGETLSSTRANPKQSHLYLQTGFTRKAVKSQFMKPYIIETRFNTHFESEDAVALRANPVRLLPPNEGLDGDKQHTSLGIPKIKHANVQTENPIKARITEPILASTFPPPHTSGSTHTNESLLDLDKHWMSLRQQHIYMSLVFFAVGFSAITALAIAIIGWLPLDTAGYVFVWPSLVTWLVLGILYPKYGKLALKGFIIGMLACLFYDCMRFTSIALGLWGDFIPRIGMWLLHTNKPDWVIGYIWRYVGDGGFMSVAFVMGYYLLKPKLDVRVAALAFGIAIWVCLIGTILLAPHGTEMLFPLTPVTFSLSLLGHIIYGLSIGYLYRIFISGNTPMSQIVVAPVLHVYHLLRK
jgi:hypothetical protein